MHCFGHCRCVDRTCQTEDKSNTTSRSNRAVCQANKPSSHERANDKHDRFHLFRRSVTAAGLAEGCGLAEGSITRRRPSWDGSITSRRPSSTGSRQLLHTSRRPLTADGAEQLGAAADGAGSQEQVMRRRPKLLTCGRGSQHSCSCPHGKLRLIITNACVLDSATRKSTLVL